MVLLDRQSPARPESWRVLLVGSRAGGGAEPAGGAVPVARGRRIAAPEACMQVHPPSRSASQCKDSIQDIRAAIAACSSRGHRRCMPPGRTWVEQRMRGAGFIQPLADAAVEGDAGPACVRAV